LETLRVKKKWSHEKCNHYYQTERCQGESRTKHHLYSWHKMRPPHYHDNAIEVTNLVIYSNRITADRRVATTRTNSKFRVKQWWNL